MPSARHLWYHPAMGEKKDRPGAAVTEEDLSAMGFSNEEGARRALEKIKASPLALSPASVFEYAAAAPSPDEALLGLAALIDSDPHKKILCAIARERERMRRLLYILGASPFLRGLLASRPGLLDWLFARKGLEETKTREDFLREIRAALAAGQYDNPEKKTGAPADPARALRLYRQAEFLRLGARDLLGLSSMKETTAELSALAGAMLHAAMGQALTELRERFGGSAGEGGRGDEESAGARLPSRDPAACGLAIIGLGKLGAGELNYSSDIDIMYVYDSAAWPDEPDGPGREEPGKDVSVTPAPLRGPGGAAEISAAEFHTRLARRVNSLISEQTPEGLVFRVDLDLRPGGSSGPLVQSLTGAELYYEAQGRDWERAAMIKAAPVAGDRAAGRAFIEMIRPFVYRRHLDFTAIEEIKTMKEKIDLSMARHTQEPGPGFNAKLGRGGIREIEFFAQTFELIHGGKDPGLRIRPTMKALEALAEKGCVDEKDAAILGKAYVFLRNLEHRLQILECRQTHTLPQDRAELRRIARMMGFETSGAFLDELRRTTEAVHSVYRGLFYAPRAEGGVDERVLLLFSPDTAVDEQKALLREMGFRDEAAALQNLELLRKGPAGLRRTSARTRELFERTAPFLLSRILASPDPDMALANLERFVSRAGARAAQYALLAENPGAAEKLIFIFGTSEFLSKGITERPEDIDLLLSPGLSETIKTRDAFLHELKKEALAPGLDLEARLDAMRRVRNAEVLRIGLCHMAGSIGPAEVSAQMTDLAEAALETAISIAREDLARRYPWPEGASFAVIGLGKLGGRELGYGSDLDIIFIYETRPEGGGQEPAPIDPEAMDYFIRLSQRIITALTIKTREGSVFSVDTRLRPSGSAGPLVVSVDSLIRYHRKKTALWERQAFIRARCVAGSRELGEGAVKSVKDIIFSTPLTPEDAAALIAMRRRMELEIGPENKRRYNFKTGRGALVDIEFLVQALVLRFAGTDRAVARPATIPALRALAETGRLDHQDAAFLEKAYAFIRRIEMAERIMRDRPETFIPRDREALAPLARAIGYKGAEPGADLLEDYEKTTRKVREIFTKILTALAEGKE